MKPTNQFNDQSPTNGRASRSSFALPKTDYNFQSSSNTGGRCFDSRRPSFRAISQDYFKNEAPHSFVREAGLFSVIVLIVAVPLLQSAHAVVHLVRSFGAL